MRLLAVAGAGKLRSEAVSYTHISTSNTPAHRSRRLGGEHGAEVR